MSIRLPLRAAQLAVVLGLAGIAYGARAQVPAQPAARFGPGTRVLLDAHNAYPERGQWSTRIDEALAQLRRAFPVSFPRLTDFAVDEPTDYPDDAAVGYEAIHRDCIDPIAEAQALSLRITTAIANLFGAHG